MFAKDIPFIKRSLRHGEYFPCLFVKWDNQSGKLVATIVSSSSLLDRAQTGLGAAVYVIGFLIRFDIPIDHVPAQLINFLIGQQTEQYGSPTSTKLQLFIRFLYVFVEVVSLLISTSLATLTMISPCQPILLSCGLCSEGKFLSRTCIKLISLLLLATFEFLTCQQICIASSYYTLTVLLQGTLFLWMSSKAFVNNYELISNLRSFEKYRELKVYEKLLNSCTRSRIFLTIALPIPCFQILLSYIFFKFFHSEDVGKFMISLCLSTYFAILVFTILLFSSAAQINNWSRSWIVKSKKRCWNMFKKRMHRSLTPLRFEFGNNFVERLTPSFV
ncbi:hypothetical protein Fcan01_10982 [Folsomia candida]|uniref:Uncharacterized protein n=1 Tax=Folsomia candida TaxID=158441 RepID=A0A226E8I6_FOLCA|nr:hypothetical protein Fcan01_10982 [Folsomia candida]